jgi:hypothetical protein
LIRADGFRRPVDIYNVNKKVDAVVILQIEVGLGLKHAIAGLATSLDTLQLEKKSRQADTFQIEFTTTSFSRVGNQYGDEV